MLTNKLDNYINFFEPAEETDAELYRMNIRVLRGVYRLLNENHLNIKSSGYTFIKDAICIIIDIGSMDVCFEKEVYRLIMDKYGIKSESKVEHCIRNTIAAAYRTSLNEDPDKDLLILSFGRRPTNKKFILRAVQEVSERIIKEL